MRERSRQIAAAGIGAAIALCAHAALADSSVSGKKAEAPAAAEPEPAWQRAPAVRRAGFMVGLSLGLGLGKAAGYPNDAKKIGRRAYYAETDIGPGGGLTLWIGGALTDWLTFGLGFVGGNLNAGDLASGGGAFTFRTEVFPLFGMGGVWRELGLELETGGGAATITNAEDTSIKLADSSGASRIGFGGFYDGIRLWRISMGPFASGDYLWSETMRRGEVQIGWRTALYAGAVSAPAKAPPKNASRR